MAEVRTAPPPPTTAPKEKGMREHIKSATPESPIYEGEVFRIWDTWREVVAGTEKRDGLVMEENSVLLNPKHADVNEIGKETQFKTMPETNEAEKSAKDEAILNEAEKRLKDKAALTDPQIVGPEEAQKNLELQEAFDKLYKIQGIIEADAQRIITETETERRKVNPKATLSKDEKDRIIMELEMNYPNRPDAIPINETFRPIITELKRISEESPTENGAISAKAEEAARLVNQLGYDETENAFRGKSEETIFKEGGEAMLDYGWDTVAASCSQDLMEILRERNGTDYEQRVQNEITRSENQLKTKDANATLPDEAKKAIRTRVATEYFKILDDGTLEKIKQNPDFKMTKLITLLRMRNNPDVSAEQGRNIDANIYLELRSIKKNAGMNVELSAATGENLGYYDDLYHGQFNKTFAKYQPIFDELHLDYKELASQPELLFQYISLASAVENAPNGLVPNYTSNTLEINPKLNELIDKMLQSRNIPPTTREIVKALAVKNRGTQMLEEIYGVDHKDMDWLSPEKLTEFVKQEMFEKRKLIPEDQKASSMQIIEANLEASLPKFKNKRNIGFFLMAAMMSGQYFQGLLDYGLEEDNRGQAGPH